MANQSSHLQIWGVGKKRISTPDGDILLFDRLKSTMDTARQVIEAGEVGVIAVQAEFQSNGRGRTGASWLAPPGGCLLITYIIPSANFSTAQLSFGAGLAAAEAIRETAGIEPSLKWPNDILISGKKTAGVIVEGFEQNSRHCFLVGIGINVNLPSFPDELTGLATSIEIETGLLTDIAELEQSVRKCLFESLNLPWSEVLDRWRNFDASAGIVYRTATEGGEVLGKATGVTDDGLLLLNTHLGVIACASATSALNKA